MNNIYILLHLLMLWLSCVPVQGSAKFHSLSCATMKPEWVVEKECYIKAFNRTNNLLNLRLALIKTITKLKVSFKLLKRESGGWHPFLYAMTVDLCAFFKNPRKYTIPSIIYSLIKQHTNDLHPCPCKANTDLYVSNYSIDVVSLISRFPVDFGEYGLHATWYTNNTIFAQINGSVIYTP